MMKHGIQSLWTAVALAASALAGTQALAATDGAPIEIAGGYMNRNVTFAFSEMLVGALNIANIPVVGMGSSRLIDDPDTGAMRVEAPLASTTVLYDDASQAYVTQSVRTHTSIFLNSQDVFPSGKKSSVRLPGWVTLSNLEIDFSTKAIYVDLAGDNGIGTTVRQHLWNFESARSSAAYAGPGGGVVLTDEVQGLTITDAGFNLFAKGLGLSPSLGIPSMKSITDYGAISIRTLAPVPEPSTFALMGLGLVGLMWSARTRRPHAGE